MNLSNHTLATSFCRQDLIMVYRTEVSGANDALPLLTVEVEEEGRWSEGAFNADANLFKKNCSNQ